MREFDEGCPVQDQWEQEFFSELRAEQNEYYKYVSFEEVKKDNWLREYSEKKQCRRVK